MNEEELLKTLKRDVMETVVMPSFKNDIIALKNERKMWDVITTLCILISAISAALTVVLIAFKYQTLSLLSSSITVAFQNMGHISKTQSQSKTTHLNTLLSQLGITPIFKDITSNITPSVSKIQGKYISQQQLNLFNANIDETDRLMYGDKNDSGNISVILTEDGCDSVNVENIQEHNDILDENNCNELNENSCSTIGKFFYDNLDGNEPLKKDIPLNDYHIYTDDKKDIETGNL